MAEAVASGQWGRVGAWSLLPQALLAVLLTRWQHRTAARRGGAYLGHALLATLGWLGAAWHPAGRLTAVGHVVHQRALGAASRSPAMA